MSTIPLVLAIALNSSNIGWFWQTPSWCPKSTSSKDTAGSDDFIREDKFELKAVHAAAFYGVLDGYAQRMYAFGGDPSSHNVTSRGLVNYDAFQSVASAIRTVPFCVESGSGLYCGGKALDAYIDAHGTGTFHPFGWCENPYDDEDANAGWFAEWGGCGDGSFSGNANTGGAIWDEVFSVINANDNVSVHDYWNDSILGYNESSPSFDEIISNAYARCYPTDINLASSKVIDWRPIEIAAQAIAVHDKAYNFLGMSDVCNSPSNRITFGKMKLQGNGTTDIVTLHGGQSEEPWLEVTSSGPLDCGSPTTESTLSFSYNNNGTSAPRIRGGKVGISGSVMAKKQIGNASCNINTFSYCVDNAIREAGYDPPGPDDTVEITTSVSESGGSFSVEGVFTGTFPLGVVITAPDGPIEMTTWGTLEASYTLYDTLNQYGGNLPTVPHYDPIVPYSKTFHSIASCVWSGGNTIPGWDTAVDFDDSAYTRNHDEICYRGATYTLAFPSSRSQDDAALSAKALEGMETICGSTAAFTSPSDYTGITSDDYDAMVSAYTVYSASIDYGEPASATGVVRRVSVGEGEYRYEVVSGSLALGLNLYAKLTASGTMPSSVTEGKPTNCAIDCNRVWCEDFDLNFPALSDSSGGQLSTNALCFTHGEFTSNRCAGAFIERRGCQGADGNDPVYRVGYGGFRRAFQRCPDLCFARFTECTDVGKFGFQGAFKECPKLYDVDFGKLTNVCDGAFEDAFLICNKAHDFDFENVENCGNYSFRRAFYNTDAESAVFTELKSCGTNAFEEAWNGVTNMFGFTFPKLETCGSEAFRRAFGGDVVPSRPIRNLQFDEMENAGYGAFEEAFAYRSYTNVFAVNGVAYYSNKQYQSKSEYYSDDRMIYLVGTQFGGRKGDDWYLSFYKDGAEYCKTKCDVSRGENGRFVASCQMGSWIDEDGTIYHGYADFCRNAGYVVRLYANGKIYDTTSWGLQYRVAIRYIDTGTKWSTDQQGVYYRVLSRVSMSYSFYCLDDKIKGGITPLAYISGHDNNWSHSLDEIEVENEAFAWWDINSKYDISDAPWSGKNETFYLSFVVDGITVSTSKTVWVD